MPIPIASDVVQTQNQLGPKDPNNLVFKFSNQALPTIYGTVTGTEQYIGHAFYLDHDVNGMLDTANGVDGQQILLDAATTDTIVRVVSLNNTFVEGFRDTTFVDTTESNATVDTNNFVVNF